VLGCAGLVAGHPGAVVVTVVAGRPGAHVLTDWDRQCGFAQGEDAMGARRHEDEAAVSLLGATPRWLDFLDRQYAEWKSPKVGDVAQELWPFVAGAPTVASPLGLAHPDHLAVATACFQLARRVPGTRWILYEDAIYRATEGRTEAALEALETDGFTLREVTVVEAPGKRAAIERYASQVRGLARLLEDASLPERYWELEKR
jgi:LmbE family N-acetylglucosaminyl deacetylase